CFGVRKESVCTKTFVCVSVCVCVCTFRGMVCVCTLRGMACVSVCVCVYLQGHGVCECVPSGAWCVVCVCVCERESWHAWASPPLVTWDLTLTSANLLDNISAGRCMGLSGAFERLHPSWTG